MRRCSLRGIPNLPQIEIQIEGSPIASWELFGKPSNGPGVGDKIEIPGGAQLVLGSLPLERRTLGHDAAVAFATLVVVFGKDVAENLVAGWIADKLRSKRIGQIRIETEAIETITQEKITRVMRQKIERD